MNWARLLLACGALAGIAGCGAGDSMRPATLDTRNDACAHCRMSVSSVRTAAQIVAPGEEPRFFDDLSCLSSWLGAGHVLPSGARIFVADHRTSSWVLADLAVFTRVPGLETPMGSGIVAHESEASRDQDDAVRGGSPVPRREVLVGQAGSGT